LQAHGVVVDRRGRGGLHLLADGHVEELAAAEVGGQQGLDLPAQLTIPTASSVQIGGSGSRIGQIERSQKDFFFGHGGVSTSEAVGGLTTNA
jgi:hypothetical protein